MTFRPAVPRSVLPFVAATVLMQAPPAAQAGCLNSPPTFVIHLTPVSDNPCDLESNPPECWGIETSGKIGTEYLAYVILASHDGQLSGARFGITYDARPGSGIDISSWTSCADFEDPTAGWPQADEGIAVTWLFPPCVSPSTMAVAGYFVLNASSPDELQVTRHPTDDKASFWNCLGDECPIEVSSINPFGWATFSTDGLAWGSSPCGTYAGGCHLRGATAVNAGQTEIEYSMDPGEVTATGVWGVAGNAELTSSNNSTAMVHATDPGAFSIAYKRVPDCTEECGCSISVQVLDSTPVMATTWGRIKRVFGVSGQK